MKRSNDFLLHMMEISFPLPAFETCAENTMIPLSRSGSKYFGGLSSRWLGGGDCILSGVGLLLQVTETYLASLTSLGSWSAHRCLIAGPRSNLPAGGVGRNMNMLSDSVRAQGRTKVL